MDQHIATQLPEARVAIRQYLLLASRGIQDLENLIDRIRAGNNAQRRAGHNPLRPLEVFEANRLAVAATWPPWNIVGGPSKERRSDDPNDHQLDRFTVGLTSVESARMAGIAGLYETLQGFIASGAAPGPTSLRTLAQAAAAARSTLSCDSPIPYRPEMWIQENGLWRKRRAEDRAAAAGQ